MRRGFIVGAVSLLILVFGLFGAAFAQSTTEPGVRCTQSGTQTFCQYATGCFELNDFYSNLGHNPPLSCDQLIEACIADHFGLFSSVSGLNEFNGWGLGLSCANQGGTMIGGNQDTKLIMPNGTFGTAYSQTLSTLLNLSEEFTWSIDGGALPNGLTFSESGLISGTPTSAGTFTFIIKEAIGLVIYTFEIILTIQLESDITWYSPLQTDFTITTAKQLAGLAQIVNGTADEIDRDNFLGKTVNLANNIDTEGQYWIPIGTSANPFRGVFDGNGKIISGLFINSTESNAGLFGVINGGTVRNLGLEGLDINGGGNAGGVAGQITGSSSITNVYTAGTVRSGGSTGGLAGVVENSSVTHSYSTCAVETESVISYTGDFQPGLFCEWSGGCWPLSQSDFQDCRNYGVVVTSCVNGVGNSNVIAAGGLAGTLRGGTLSNNAALNPEIAISGAGRIVGRTEGTPTLSNNLAFSDMLNANGTTVWSNKGPNQRNGGDITGEMIYEFGDLLGRFTTPPWAVEDGKLPGFGQAREIPDYIKSGPYISSVSVSPSNSSVIFMGSTTITFSAAVTGVNNPPATVTWSVTGNNSDETVISQNGVLTITSDETSSTLTVRAVSTLDNTKYGTATVAVTVVPAMAGAGTSDSPYIITMAEQLAFLAIKVNEGDANFNNKHYRLGGDIDISDFGEHFNNGRGWTPIGSSWNNGCFFSGVFDGNNKVISGLYINSTGVNEAAGLFGYIYNGTVKNLGFEDVNITASFDAGGIVGLLGGDFFITNTYTTGTITIAGRDAGGIVGSAFADFNSSMSNSYSAAAVTGSTAGGLIGRIVRGGLSPDAVINITNCYSTGAVSGSTNAGGLVGFRDASVTVTSSGNFWDMQTSGQTTSAVGTGRSTSQMRTQATFTGWDFTAIWRIDNGADYPRLRFVPNHIVAFVDGLGNQISIQTVIEGADAVVPVNPTRETHNFTSWDGDYTNVTSNRTITAQWAIKTYTVTFVDWNDEVLKTQTGVVHGTGASAPEDPVRTGYIFRQWDVAFNNVTGNLTVKAIYGISTPILSSDRVIPPGGIGEKSIDESVSALTSEFTAGPNPVARSAGKVNLFRVGKSIQNGTLTVFDASGNVVNRINIRDVRVENFQPVRLSSVNDQSKRIVGSWDLRDQKGRTVSEGTYLLRGTITTSDGKRERVSLMVGVR